MKHDNDEANYINYKDLKVGANLSIYGKNIFLYDCDQYTREFYQVNRKVNFSGH